MLTIHDGKPAEKPRKYSITANVESEEIEKITFPPSTELIQDEYQHENNRMGLVYIFYSTADEHGMELLKEALSDQEYKVPPENTIEITTREVVLNALQRIASEDNNDKSCLLVFILGNSIGDDLILPEQEPNSDWKNCITVKDVWINFTGEHCHFFTNKPKIFVFQGSQKLQYTQHDSLIKKVKTEYGFPAEADMLVIYNKVESTRRNRFIEHFCNDLHEFGKEDDVIGIVTRFEQQHDQRPLIISTLTRKFFISPNRYRGHHYEYNSNYDSLLDMVSTLDQKVDLVMDFVSNSRRISGQKRNSSNNSMHVVDGRSKTTPTASVLAKPKRTTSASSNRSAGGTTIMPPKARWR